MSRALLSAVALSLALNFALVTWWWHLPPIPSSVAAIAAPSSANPTAATSPENLSALVSPDSPTPAPPTSPDALLSYLRDEGFPPRTLRFVARALARRTLTADQIAALLLPRSDALRIAAETALRNETNRLLDPLALPDDELARVRRAARFGPIPREKSATLERALADPAGVGSQLPSLLDSLLTPEERFEFDVRGSSRSYELARELGAMHLTEAEFRAIFASRRGSLLSTQLRTTLGEERYAEYERESSADFRGARRMLARAGQPVAEAPAMWSVFTAAFAQARDLSIGFNDPTPAQRASLELIARSAEAQLRARYGEAGARMFSEIVSYGSDAPPPLRALWRSLAP